VQSLCGAVVELSWWCQASRVLDVVCGFNTPSGRRSRQNRWPSKVGCGQPHSECHTRLGNADAQMVDMLVRQGRQVLLQGLQDNSRAHAFAQTGTRAAAPRVVLASSSRNRSPGYVAREVIGRARKGRSQALGSVESMGCFNSKEASPGGASSSVSKPAPKHHHAGGHMKPKPAAPDAMLAKTFEYIQQLGKGGTGDTGLFKDLQSGEEVAIKLIRRPLPKVIMPNILREVTVSLALLLSLYDLLGRARGRCSGARSILLPGTVPWQRRRARALGETTVYGSRLFGTCHSAG